jgi:hypothetical protein
MLIPIKYRVETNADITRGEWKNIKPEILKNQAVSKFKKMIGNSGIKFYEYVSVLDREMLLSYLAEMDSISLKTRAIDEGLKLECRLSQNNIYLKIEAMPEPKQIVVFDNISPEEFAIKQQRYDAEIRTVNEKLLYFAVIVDKEGFIMGDEIDQKRELIPDNIEVDMHTYEMFV